MLPEAILPRMICMQIQFVKLLQNEKSQYKYGHLLLEIGCLAALNRHRSRRWGPPHPGPAPGPADSHRHRNSIRLEQGRNRGAADEYLDAGEAEIDQDGGPFQSPLKGEYGTHVIHFFAVNLIMRYFLIFSIYW